MTRNNYNQDDPVNHNRDHDRSDRDDQQQFGQTSGNQLNNPDQRDESDSIPESQRDYANRIGGFYGHIYGYEGQSHPEDRVSDEAVHWSTGQQESDLTDDRRNTDMHQAPGNNFGFIENEERNNNEQ